MTILDSASIISLSDNFSLKKSLNENQALFFKKECY